MNKEINKERTECKKNQCKYSFFNELVIIQREFNKLIFDKEAFFQRWELAKVRLNKIYNSEGKICFYNLDICIMIG
jgi:hypothetical protein